MPTECLYYDVPNEDTNNEDFSFILGITNLRIMDLLNVKNNSPAFFSRYSTAGDPLNRIASIIIGPIAAVFAALACVGQILAELTVAIAELKEGNIPEFKENLNRAGYAFLLALGALIGAALSPLLNTLDLIGALIHTCIPEQQKHSTLVP